MPLIVDPIALRWSQTIASHGIGPTRTIDIDVHIPGEDYPRPVEIPLADAEVLYAMLGDAIAGKVSANYREDDYAEYATGEAARRLYPVSSSDEA